jgi:hypothetical protein
MQAGDCCDMTGAIAFFKAIDPEVRAIETFSGWRASSARRDGTRSEAYV